jgi:hypothetical protein
MLSQVPSVEAVHAHSRAAETLMVPDPPCAGTLPLPLALRPHRGSVVGDVTVDEDEPQAAATTNDAQTIAPVMTRQGDDTLGRTVVVRDTAAEVVSRILPYSRDGPAARRPQISKDFSADRLACR